MLLDLQPSGTHLMHIFNAMSGTSAGTVVLHVAPEAAVGGPLALVRDGDRIEFAFRSLCCARLLPQRA